MLDFSLPIILATFGIIFIAELPDKTVWVSLALAAKYKASQVLIGVWLALLVQTIVAAVAGSFLTLLPQQPIRLVAGIGFIIFALIALFRKEEVLKKKEEQEVERVPLKNTPVWVKSFWITFIAEWGDLTQLATIALIAREGHPLSVSIGAVAALWSVSALAALSGAQLKRVLNPKKINMISGIVFGIVGLIIIFFVIRM